MNLPLPRRDFVKRTTLYSFGLAMASLPGRAQIAKSPGEKLVVGVMGLSRGAAHVQALRQIVNAEVAYLCEVDENRLAQVQKSAFGNAEKQPRTVKDFRRILDDKDVDALF